MRPVQGAAQIITRLRLMQPEFIFRNNQGGSNQPDAGSLLLHQNLASGKLLAYRNLSVGSNDLDTGLGSESFHMFLRIS